jgi:hypothetical protein
MIQQTTLVLPARRDPLARVALFALVFAVVAINIFQPQFLPIDSAQAQIVTTATPAQPAPTEQSASAALTMPTPTSVPAQPRLVTAYAAPLGVALGPLDLNEGVAPVGRYGNDWLQVQRGDGSRVWLASGDAPDLQQLAALQPDAMPPTPQPYQDSDPVLARAQYTQGQVVEPPALPAQTVLDQSAALYATLPTAGPMPAQAERKTCTEAQMHAPRGANCALPQNP